MVKIDWSESDCLLVEGELTKFTVSDALDEGKGFIQQRHALHIDLRGVTRSDSAALSLLLCWLRFAKQHRIALTFINLPAKMLDLARVSCIDKLLPMVITA